MQRIIEITNGVPRMPEWRLAQPVNFILNEGEHIAVTGDNASGKSMFVDIITGRHPLLADEPKYDFTPSRHEMVSENIKHIAFRDSYGDSDGQYCLQRRWNQQEIDSETPVVGDLLEKAFLISGDDTAERRAMQSHLYDLFHIRHLLDKYIILLSSGELRKFQLVKTLLADPRVLVIDNPFIGLDADTRDQVKQLLAAMTRERPLQVILVLSKPDDIPDFITHIVEVNDMVVGEKITREQYFAGNSFYASCDPLTVQSVHDAVVNLPYRSEVAAHGEVIRMNDVSIRYGERVILDSLNWTVMSGERWALSGQNGAGKSTLLSLVCADNPQSYACDITLFGRQRGSGESIWDVKRRIGYVSPEMHRAYSRNLPAVRIVASGLHDSVGLYVKSSPSEYAVCRWWMDVFGLRGKEDTSFLKLSSGEQRLVLLARAFVKDPQLLILDEPLHGLDPRRASLVKHVVEAFCERRGKTLVMVSHYEDELPSCIDHRLFLKRHV